MSECVRECVYVCVRDTYIKPRCCSYLETSCHPQPLPSTRLISDGENCKDWYKFVRNRWTEDGIRLFLVKILGLKLIALAQASGFEGEA